MKNKKQVKNEMNPPKVHYCRHIEKGVAYYDESDDMLLVKDDALHKMKKSMSGVPVFVGHQPVDLENIKEQADGYIAECFYNELDGWFWAKFICVSDNGARAIKMGHSVSNSYMITDSAGGGVYHNINYDKEVIDGYYTHLAIVDNPRYEGAFIVDEEEYKMYNKTILEKKELQNSKKSGGFKMKLFKNKKEEVKDIDNETMIELENGKAVKLEDMIKIVIENEKEKDKDDKEKVNMEAKVKVGEKDMSIKELVNKYMEYEKDKKNESEDDDKKKKEEEEAKKKENEEKDDKDDKDDKEKNEDKNEEEEKKNALAYIKKFLENENKNEKENKLSEEEKKLGQEFFNKMKKNIDNAKAPDSKEAKYETMAEKIKTGKERY